MKLKKWQVVLIALVIVLGGCFWLLHNFFSAIERAVMWGTAQEIHIAAYEDDVTKLSELLASGVDPQLRASADGQFWFDVTPLHVAAERDAIDSIAVLIAAGADVDTPDRLGRSPLFAAVEKCSERAAEMLLAAGANPHGSGKGKWIGDAMPFHLALHECSIDLVTDFLDYITLEELVGEADFICIKDPDRLEKMRLLLSTIKDVDTTESPNDLTYLGNAAINGDLAFIQLLLDHGADINLPSGSENLTPVFWAAYAGKTKAMCELLDHGANPHTGTEWYGSLIYVASFNGHTETVRELLSRDLDISLDVGRTSDGATPLHLAYWNRNPELIEILLEAGADPEIHTKDGRKPHEFIH